MAINVVGPLVETPVLACRRLALLSRYTSPGAGQICRPCACLAAVLAPVRLLKQGSPLFSLRPISDETARATALISIASPLIPCLSTAVVITHEAVVVEIDGLLPPSDSPSTQFAKFGGQNFEIALPVGKNAPTGDGRRVSPTRRHSVLLFGPVITPHQGRITCRLFVGVAQTRGRRVGRDRHFTRAMDGGGTTRLKGPTSAPSHIEVGGAEVLSLGNGLARLSLVEGRSRQKGDGLAGSHA